MLIGRTEHRRAAVDTNEPNQTQQTQFAKTAQVSASDRSLLPGIAGKDDDLGADLASPAPIDAVQPIGAQPRIDVTGHHQPGMGANETADGLSGTEEALRAAAEDTTEGDEFEETPVFDRADIIPKII
jgi:hypothetical protein